MHPQFINGRKRFCTKLALVLSFAVMCSDMFTDNGIFSKRSRTIRAVESSILTSMSLDVVFEHQYLVKKLPTHWAFEYLFIF